MNIWLINDGENLPVDGKNPRLQRMGLLAYKLGEMGVNVTWWQSTLNHYKKEYRADKDTDVELTPQVTLKMIHSSIGYKKNVSLRRLVHQWHMAKKFYKKANQEPVPDLILCCMPTLEFLHFAVKYAKKKRYTDISISTFFSDLDISRKALYMSSFHKLIASEN